MGRRRRRIFSNSVYEVCFRARDTLPFVAYVLIKFIINCVLAWAQRDQKVIICHDIWEGSHCHMLLVSKDAKAFVDFLAEVQKRMTDIFKRLLGRRHLRIWEGRPSIIRIGSLSKARERIAYFYANPAQDGLVESIEKFPGLSSYLEFLSCFESLQKKKIKSFPSLKLPKISKLPNRVLSSLQDRNITRLLAFKHKKEKFDLIRQPNEWMKYFEVTTDEEVRLINQEIFEAIKLKEQLATEKHRRDGIPFKGVAKLTSEVILRNHTPQKYAEKIYVLSDDKNARIAEILEHREFCEACKRCYLEWKRGELLVEWPPGAFRPPLPPSYNLLP